MPALVDTSAEAIRRRRPGGPTAISGLLALALMASGLAGCTSTGAAGQTDAGPRITPPVTSGSNNTVQPSLDVLQIPADTSAEPLGLAFTEPPELIIEPMDHPDLRWPPPDSPDPLPEPTAAETEDTPDDQPQPEPPPDPEPDLVLPDDVLFESGKAVVSKLGHAAILDFLGQVEAQRPDAMITVEGHTDTRGTSRSNLLLSRRRANAVVEILVKNGWPKSQVKGVGRGESETAVPDVDEAGAFLPIAGATNRRVEVFVAAA